MSSPMGARQPLYQPAQSLLNALIMTAATVVEREDMQGFLSPRLIPVPIGCKATPILNPIWRHPSLGASQPNVTPVTADPFCIEDVGHLSLHLLMLSWDLDLSYLSIMLLPVPPFLNLLTPHMLFL